MKKKKFMMVGAIAALAVIGGVFAYFNQTLTIENPFDTGKFDSVLVEDFNPEDGDKWQPGSTVNKDIEVKNTGDNDLLVRVKFDEKWSKKGDDNTVIKENKEMNDETSQDSATDGLVEKDGSIVTKTLANKENWVFHNGYWYYKSNLKAEKTTGKFLDSVTLLENADMGVYKVKNYYTTAADAPAQDQIGEDADSQWKEFEGKVPDGAKHSMSKTVLTNESGYADANYTLTITAQTVQATENAVKEAFGTDLPTGVTWTYMQ